MFIRNLFILICLVTGTFSYAQESNLRNITKLTYGGDNAEAYFSPDSKMLTMQITNPALGADCDQIYMLELNKKEYKTSDLKRISTGLGRTTCSFFMPDGKHILYASTHKGDKACPHKPAPRADGKYVWPIYPDFDIYIANLKGKIVKQLTNTPGYDAEAVLSPDGKYIVFTSTRSGDLELWRMDADGKNLIQLTDGLGYDGGAFFSHDSKKLVFRSSRPKTEKDIREYKELLAQHLVAPTNMEIYTMNIDGSDLRQITHLGKANWSPYFHPSDKKILFSSNHHSTRGYDFQIYSIDIDGSNLRQITYESGFNAFPMFSPDGKKIAFSSNRLGATPHETNVFLADWVDTDSAEIIQQGQLKKAIGYLASDDLMGRLTGSKGETKAAIYLYEKLVNWGLKTSILPFEYGYRKNPHDENSAKEQIIGKNVIGYLDNKADKTIIIGAHYDHLGLNEHHNSTLANSDGQIHNGADDNASGTAAVLEIARMFSTNLATEKANYIFAFFSGEEDGLVGSKAFAETIHSYPNPVAMINMDMVGRLNADKALTVGGVGTSPIFGKLVEQYKPAGVNIAIDSSGTGPSDHTSFYLKDIPVLFLFTGTHEDYHKPGDDEEKINYPGVTLITQYAFNLAQAIEQQNTIPFTKTKIQQGKAVPKYKVTLGIMPSYGDTSDGLHIDGVVDDRPGSKAGILTGDILTQLGDCKIKEVYSYMECLSHINAGDEVQATIIRNGKPMQLTVKF